MDIKEQKRINAKEFHRHPWEMIRLEFIINILKNVYRNNSFPSSILDIGAGDLYISELLSNYFLSSKIVSVDTAYEHCFDSGRVHVVNSMDSVPNDRYSLILLLDVLEHINDDVGFLSSLVKRFSSSNTIFLIAVPLHPSLFSEHDINLGHRRRYDYTELLSRVKETGLNIINSGNLFSSLFIFRMLQVIIGKVFGKLRPGKKGASFADVSSWNHSVLLTTIVKTLLRLDVKYANRFPGLSGYVLASVKR